MSVDQLHGDPVEGEVHPLLAAARRAVAALAADIADDGAGSLPLDGATLRELGRVGRVLDAVRTTVTASFEDAQGHRQDAEASTESWCRNQMGESFAESRRRVQAGRVLAQLPAARAAALDGSLSAGHVSALDHARREAPEAFAVGGEAELLDAASGLDPERFRRHVQRWIERVAADRAEARRRRLVEQRVGRVRAELDGSFSVHARLCPSGAHQFVTVWDAFTEAQARLDRSTLAELERQGVDADTALGQLRTRDQHRADALVEMARAASLWVRAGDDSKMQGSRVRPRVEVAVPVEMLRRPDSGSASEVEVRRALGAPLRIPQSLADEYSCDAEIVTVVTDRAGTETLHYGRAERVVPLRLRRYLEHRDGGCVVPGCGAPPGMCHAHHVVHWARGGTTDPGNCALVCNAHHRQIHDGWLEMTGDPDTGELRWSTPRAGPPGDPSAATWRSPPPAGRAPRGGPRSPVGRSRMNGPSAAGLPPTAPDTAPPTTHRHSAVLAAAR